MAYEYKKGDKTLIIEQDGEDRIVTLWHGDEFIGIKIPKKEVDNAVSHLKNSNLQEV